MGKRKVQFLSGGEVDSKGKYSCKPRPGNGVMVSAGGVYVHVSTSNIYM
jgi:hypothetical protein